VRRGIHWNTAGPPFILGAVPDSSLNVLFPLSVYVSVQRYLRKPLEYLSDPLAWETTQSPGTAMMNSYLFGWVVLTYAAKDQSFNASDDCTFT